MRPVTDLERRVAPFQVVSDYQPAGDQPAAITEITKRIRGGVEEWSDHPGYQINVNFT